MRSTRRLFLGYAVGCLVLVGMLSSAHAAERTEAELCQMLADGQAVALLRHAIAPGFSDPDNFTLGDCATQRNLSDDGRAQARQIGDRFRAHGIEQALVRSSQWCRTMDTARLLALGPVTPTPALNSFFADRGARAEQTQAARQLILADDGERPRVFVTHQVNINALSGRSAASGEIVVVRPIDDALETVGRIAAPE